MCTSGNDLRNRQETETISEESLALTFMEALQYNKREYCLAQGNEEKKGMKTAEHREECSGKHLIDVSVLCTGENTSDAAVSLTKTTATVLAPRTLHEGRQSPSKLSGNGTSAAKVV